MMNKAIMWSICLFFCVFLSTTVVSAQVPAVISGITDNRSSYPNNQIPAYSKFEITFQVQTTATNPDLPYDMNPPAGIDPGNPSYNGVTVDAVFKHPTTGQEHRQPAFFYQDFDYQIKGGIDWIYPNGKTSWKVRFSPPVPGIWQYQIEAQDKSNAPSWYRSDWQSVTVVSSTSKGFVKVSSRDPRYFEYDNGDYFVGLGYNENYRGIDWVNPVLANTDKFQKMGQNGIEFIRIWLSQWSIFSSAWNPWRPHEGNDYLTETSLNTDNVYPGSEFSMQLWANWNKCIQWGWETYNLPLKRNTDYKVQVRHFTGLISPKDSSKPYGFVVKRGGWLWNGDGASCYDSSVGTVISDYQSINTENTPQKWQMLNGTFNSGSDDYMGILYLALENVIQGGVYIDSISIQEDLGNGQFGPNIIPKPKMDHHIYFDQRNSYAFDKVLNIAEQNNVYLRPVLLEKNEHIFNVIDFNGTVQSKLDNQWFYGNYRQKTKTRWLLKAFWRYAQARWGYSTSIHSWELLNEGDPYNGYHYTLTDEFGKYMHCEVFGVSVPDLNQNGNGDGDRCKDIYDHPNDHPISTSTWHSFPQQELWNNSNFPNIDFADVHKYIESDRSIRINDATVALYSPSDYFDEFQWNTKLGDLIGAQKQFGPGKPVVRGETSLIAPELQYISQTDTAGVWLHNFVWSLINSGGVYDPAEWYPYYLIHTSTFDHRPQFKPYYEFIKTIPLSNGHYQDITATVSNPNIRITGQKDTINGNAHLWVQNKQHTWKNVVDNVSITSQSGTITIGGFTPGNIYRLEPWNTYTGTPQTTTDITADNQGILTITVSNLTTDTAYKILNPSQSTVTETPTPSPLPGDANGDRAVNILDYQILANTFGSTIDLRADFNGSGNINILDYQILANNFGRSG